MEKIDLGKDLFLAMGKGKRTLEQAMETALEKAAYRHLQYLSEDPAYAEWWGSADSWDSSEYQAWYSEEYPASVSYSSRPLRKGKRGRGYPQPAEEPLGKGQGSKPPLKRHQQKRGGGGTPQMLTKKALMGPVNNKEKFSGSGTTSDARRKRRLGKQWDVLEKAGAAYKPDSEESMDTHIDQLNKALEKAKERKEQLRGTSPSPTSLLQLLPPRLEETHWALRPLSTRGRRTLERVEEENVQETRVLKRQRSISRGETGPRVDAEASFKTLEKAREELEAKKAAELGKAEETRKAKLRKGKNSKRSWRGVLGKGYSCP